MSACLKNRSRWEVLALATSAIVLAFGPWAGTARAQALTPTGAPRVNLATWYEVDPAWPQKPAEVAAAKPAAPVAPVAKPEPAVKPEVKVAALSEAEGLALAKKSNCLTRHAIDKKVVGPAWKDVAAKYRGDAGAEERLPNVIAKGGRGNWGGMAMPANPQVNEADRRSLARFVLSLK